MTERINQIIEYLHGTSITIDQACEDLELGITEADLTMEELEELDNWLFYCEECGWWYDVGERSSITDANVCIYCSSDFEI